MAFVQIGLNSPRKPLTEFQKTLTIYTFLLHSYMFIYI